MQGVEDVDIGMTVAKYEDEHRTLKMNENILDIARRVREHYHPNEDEGLLAEAVERMAAKMRMLVRDNRCEWYGCQYALADTLRELGIPLEEAVESGREPCKCGVCPECNWARSHE